MREQTRVCEVLEKHGILLQRQKRGYHALVADTLGGWAQQLVPVICTGGALGHRGSPKGGLEKAEDGRCMQPVLYGFAAFVEFFVV